MTGLVSGRCCGEDDVIEEDGVADRAQARSDKSKENLKKKIREDTQKRVIFSGRTI